MRIFNYLLLTGSVIAFTHIAGASVAATRPAQVVCFSHDGTLGRGESVFYGYGLTVQEAAADANQKCVTNNYFARYCRVDTPCKMVSN